MSLYDPREFPKTVSPDFTLEEFLAWVRTKPAEGSFNYYCDECAIGQFLVDTGRASHPVMGDTWWSEEATYWAGGDTQEFDERADAAVQQEPHTFGALAARLEAELAR